MEARLKPCANAEKALEARDLVMTFTAPKGQSVTALTGVSISAKQGRVTGLVGPDGAGKTTFLRIAAGLMPPTAGRMVVLGMDITGDAAGIRSRIGYMPQQFGLYEDLTVRENLNLYADLQGVPKPLRAERFERLMAMADLVPFGARLAGRLSGGMKQKLGLACCLVKAPELLILDEPTVGVDPVSRRDLWRIVEELVTRDGVGVVFSTAYLDEAERCHHVVLLHEGAKLEEGPPDRLRDRVRGRVFRVSPAGGVAPRDLQGALARSSGVVDATIRSGRVRTVWKVGGPPDLPEVPEARGAVVAPAEPLFEDAFVDRLAAAGVGGHLAGTPVAPGSFAPAVTSGEVVVSVHNLTKRFGNFTAVREIGFQVRRGEVFGLLGANGAGKTTTFRMLCGLLPASEGEIRIAGRDLRRAPARTRSRLGYMAQKFSLYRQLTVSQNLRFYGSAYGLDGRRLRARVEWALEEFDLRARRNQASGGLPVGYRQRLAMAAALLHEPDILFLDEPTSGADPLARREFWLRINGFARSGVTVIVTTHFMEEAEFCDHMVIMSRGESLASGTPASIRALAQIPGRPEPSVEDAFVALTDGAVRPNAGDTVHG